MLLINVATRYVFVYVFGVWESSGQLAVIWNGCFSAVYCVNADLSESDGLNNRFNNLVGYDMIASILKSIKYLVLSKQIPYNVSDICVKFGSVGVWIGLN